MIRGSWLSAFAALVFLPSIVFASQKLTIDYDGQVFQANTAIDMRSDLEDAYSLYDFSYAAILRVSLRIKSRKGLGEVFMEFNGHRTEKKFVRGAKETWASDNSASYDTVTFDLTHVPGADEWILRFRGDSFRILAAQLKVERVYEQSYPAPGPIIIPGGHHHGGHHGGHGGWPGGGHHGGHGGWPGGHGGGNPGPGWPPPSGLPGNPGHPGGGHGHGGGWPGGHGGGWPGGHGGGHGGGGWNPPGGDDHGHGHGNPGSFPGPQPGGSTPSWPGPQPGSPQGPKGGGGGWPGGGHHGGVQPGGGVTGGFVPGPASGGGEVGPTPGLGGGGFAPPGPDVPPAIGPKKPGCEGQFGCH